MCVCLGDKVWIVFLNVAFSISSKNTNESYYVEIDNQWNSIQAALSIYDHQDDDDGFE